jgi:hypothetical protein
MAADDDEAGRMAAAAWATVEALGMPDTSVRRVYFDLADIIGGGEPTEMAMASAAFLALSREMREVYTRKSPLQQQLEHIRVRKELAEMLGERVRELPGEAFTLEPLPTTPAALGEELGYRDGGRAVRRVLRARHPEHDKGTMWSPLSEAQVNYVRAHLPRRA